MWGREVKELNRVFDLLRSSPERPSIATRVTRALRAVLNVCKSRNRHGTAADVALPTPNLGAGNAEVPMQYRYVKTEHCMAVLNRAAFIAA